MIKVTSFPVGLRSLSNHPEWGEMCITPGERSVTRGWGITTHKLNPEGVEPTSGFRFTVSPCLPGLRYADPGLCTFYPIRGNCLQCVTDIKNSWTYDTPSW